MFDALGQMLTVNVLNVIAAVVILVVGWLIALILAAGVRGGLRRTKLSEQMGKWFGEKEGAATSADVERWIHKAVYYLAMFFVVIAFFQVLGLTLIAEPLNRFLTQIFQYLPALFGALVLLVVALVLASIIRIILSRTLVALKVDERLGEGVGWEEEKRIPLSQTISKVAYWVVLLLFLPAILTALQLQGLLTPVQNMTDRVLTFLPNILAAGLILLAGWFLARILRRITASLLVSAGADRLSERLGLAQIMGRQQISNLAGLLLYAFIIIISIIAALNALALEAITQPASSMLNMILEALPAIFAAILVLLIAYVVGRVVASLANNLLQAAGFNAILVRLGLTKETPKEGKWSPSEMVGYVILVIIMLFAVIEAAGLLGFALLADLVAQLLVFLSHVILGLVIFGIGLYLAHLAYQAISVSETPQATFLARIAKYAILVLAGAMALQRMGLADEIILVAFGMILGAIAISAILAFGLGGREIAARELDEWVKNYKSKQ